ncbi:MAG: hypothetical protein GF308_04555 [Candidatus Heimdallarchaeota archaeon]|nr:hypothetical protein [Candidatus Heimdallarchaeota archaeon]
MNEQNQHFNQEERQSGEQPFKTNNDFKFEKDSSDQIEKLDTNSSKIKETTPESGQKTTKSKKKSIQIISERDIPLTEGVPPNFSSKFQCWCHFRRTKFSQRVKLELKRKQ